MAPGGGRGRPEVVFLLEEESARALLEALCPRLGLAHDAVRYIVFQGKQDLQQQLERKLRAYQNPDACFIVVHDQDTADCAQLKADLMRLCPTICRPRTMICIACRELESFFLADLRAVGLAFGDDKLAPQQPKRKYRRPDDHPNAYQMLRELTGNQYQRINGSRAIGFYLDLDSTRSPSFAYLVRTIRCAAAS